MTSINFGSDDILLTSVLDQIEIITDKQYLDIVLKSDKAGTLFNQRFWAFNSSITLWDVSYIIENFMRQSGAIILDDISLQAFYGGELQASASAKVVYCESINEEGGSFDFKNNFITTSGPRRIAPDSSVFLFAYGSDASSFSVSYRYRLKGSDKVNSGVLSGLTSEKYDNLMVLNIHLSQLKNHAATSSALSLSDIEICSFDVTCNNRLANFTVDKSLEYGHLFYFRNCFNCPDFITVSAVTTAKTEVERSLALFGSRAVFYDQVNEKNYDVETGPLLKYEADFIDQLIASPQVYKIIRQQDTMFLAQLILITESTCNIADDDDPNSVKYTWRYADNRLHKQLTESSLLKIFTYQFNYSFV